MAEAVTDMAAMAENIKDLAMANWKMLAVVVVCLVLVVFFIWFTPTGASLNPFKSKLECDIDELMEKIDKKQSTTN